MRISKAILDLISRRIVVTPRLISMALNVSLKQAQNALQYLARTKKVKKICWGYYTTFSDPKVIGCHIVPSYISFLSALSLWGVSTQVVTIYSLATTQRISLSEKCLSNIGIRYIKIPRRAFLGYTWIKSSEGGIYFIAEPEKAIVDMIYIGQNVNSAAIDWSRIETKKLLMYSKYFSKKMRRKIQVIVSKFSI